MKRDPLDLLACAACVAPRELCAEDAEGDRIATGSTRRARFSQAYPIRAGNPDLMPKEAGRR